MGLDARAGILVVCVGVALAGCGGGGGGGGSSGAGGPPPPSAPPQPTLVAAQTNYSPSGRLHEQGYNLHRSTGPDVRTGTWKEYSDAAPPVLISQKTYVDGVWDQTLPWFLWTTAGAPVDDWTNANLTPPYASFDTNTGGNHGIIISGAVDTTLYQNAAVDQTLAGVNQRIGPDYAYFHGSTNPSLPTIYQRYTDGRYIYGTLGTPVDFAGTGGQVFYQPNSSTNYGVDRIRFSWSSHGGFGATQYFHDYRLQPTIDNTLPDAQWACSPDTSVNPNRNWPTGTGANDWAAAVGDLHQPIAVARAKGEWSNCGILVFKNGLIGASGYGNNDDRYPFTQLAANKVPTAVALTPNNEFALITVWDTSLIKGQVAVVALEARAPGMLYHEWWYAGMPSDGTYTRLKVLGYIDLPSTMKAPTAISASSDVTRWAGVDAIHTERLDTQAIRDKWNTSVDADHQASSAGYAIVASRSENQIVFIDLEPLFQYYRSMYFTTQANFDLTTNEGAADNQWPFTFVNTPSQVPTVGTPISVPQPTAVAAGLVLQYPSTFSSDVFVATMDGRLLLFDAGYLAVVGSSGAGVTALGGCKVGLNPTCIAYGRQELDRQHLAITCRGDRQVSYLYVTNNEVYVTKTLQDSRLMDPVYVDLSETRAAQVMSVADFTAGTVGNYLYLPIDVYDQFLYGGLGPDGSADFEFTGAMTVPGHPFLLSSAEVN